MNNKSSKLPFANSCHPFVCPPPPSSKSDKFLEIGGGGERNVSPLICSLIVSTRY